MINELQDLEFSCTDTPSCVPNGEDQVKVIFLDFFSFGKHYFQRSQKIRLLSNDTLSVFLVLVPTITVSYDRTTKNYQTRQIIKKNKPYL